MRNHSYIEKPVYANGIKFASRGKADRYIALTLLEIAGNVKGYQCDECDTVFDEFVIDSEDPCCTMCGRPVEEIKDIKKELREVYTDKE